LYLKIRNKDLREVERKSKRKRKRVKSLKIKEVIEILGAKLKLWLGLLPIEVRGLVFYHNLLIVISSLIIFKSA